MSFAVNNIILQGILYTDDRIFIIGYDLKYIKSIPYSTDQELLNSCHKVDYLSFVTAIICTI